VCSATTQVETSVESVTQTGGSAAVQMSLQNIESAATGLAKVAPEEFGPEVDALRRSIDALRSAVTGLAGQPNPSADLGAITTAVGDMQASVQGLVAKARAQCPSLAPLPSVPPPTATS
jgi:hypothetical protein